MAGKTGIIRAQKHSRLKLGLGGSETVGWNVFFCQPAPSLTGRRISAPLPRETPKCKRGGNSLANREPEANEPWVPDLPSTAQGRAASTRWDGNSA